MKNYLFLILLLPGLLLAQRKNKDKMRAEFTVIGSVLDSLDTKGLSFATVSFLNIDNDALVTGGICDELGAFTIEKVSGGSYNLLIEYIGYEPRIIKNLKVRPSRKPQVDGVSGGNTAGDKSVNLGVFKLVKSVEQLQEIELIEEKSLIVQGIDRKIFNVGQDITSSGGSAIELMEKLPSVQVDMDGNLSLRGSDQVRLYVDGKPSMLTSSELLETMPSSIIESVELITNPSAKFSPEGMAGIINIVLKKNKPAGFNGNLSATAGYPLRTNFTSLLNRRTEKLNIFGSYSYMNRENGFISDSEKHTYFNGDTFNLYQEKWGNNSRASHTFKGGLDYTPNETTSLSVQGKYAPSIRSKMDTVNYREDTVDYENEFDRLTDSETIQNSWDIDVSGKKDWANGLHLDFGVNKSQNTKDNSNLYTETILNSIDLGFDGYTFIQELSNVREDNQFEAKLDFSFGKEDSGKFEWGLSSRSRSIDQDQFSQTDSTLLGAFSPDSGLINHFIYQDEVYAAFATYAKSYGVFSLQAGLRAEQVNTLSELRNDSSTFKLDYFELYPSLHLSYKLDETASLQASYSRRVNRPGFYSLNPFPEYSDPYNLRMGNPYLKPEFINSVELGYQKFAKGTTFSTSVYAKDLNNMQRRFITVDSNSVSTVNYRNLNGSLDLGIEFMWSKQLTKTFNFMISSNIYHSQMDASNLTDEYDESTLRMSSNFNTAYKKNGHKLQLSGWVMPGGSVGQGTMRTMFSTDLAYSGPIFSNKAKFTIKISDLFNTRGFGIDTQGASFDQSFWYKRQTQSINVSLSYNFGDQSNNRSRRGGSRGVGDMDGGFF